MRVEPRRAEDSLCSDDNAPPQPQAHNRACHWDYERG